MLSPLLRPNFNKSASVPVTTITSGAWATSSAARRERPRRRAAEKRDEAATPDANCHLIHPA
jgi:hypothetical protein